LSPALHTATSELPGDFLCPVGWAVHGLFVRAGDVIDAVYPVCYFIP
jgi:hypothetical protein